MDTLEGLRAVAETESCQEAVDVIRKVQVGIDQGTASGPYFASECELLGML